MSIALLRGKDFKHRLQDDMESIYYVLFIASILYLPRAEVKEFEVLVSRFLDQDMVPAEGSTGGVYKIANVASDRFREKWEFDNALVQKCLDELIELQGPFQDQPDWTPQAFYSILESTDLEDLPLDDRMDHCQIKRDKAAQRQAWYDLQYDLEYGHTSSKEPFPSPTKTAGTSSVQSETASKRSVEEAELEACGEPTKRVCSTVSVKRVQDQPALVSP